MKKVILTINNNQFAGIERFCLLLGKYIDKSKFDLIIVMPSYGEVSEIFKKNNIKFFCLNKKNVIKKNTFYGIFQLVKLLIKEKPDILHAQAGILPCILGKIVGIKKIIEHKHGLDFTQEQLLNFGFFRLTYEKMKKYFTDYTVTVCSKDKEVLLKKFNYRSDKTIVVYNGIESEDCVKKMSDKLVIGNIGRLTYQKAQDRFIQLAGILLEKYTNTYFYIYGKGENEEEYKKLISKLNIADNVFIKGFSSNIKEIFSTLDLFILTSRYEGIPYILLEAMNYGIPVISTDVGGINEIITNNENGFIVPNGSLDKLRETAEILIENPDKRNEFRTKAKETLDKNFSIENCVNNVVSIYNQ